MSQQGLLQESVRAVTSTSLDFNGDLMTLFDQAGAGGTHWNEKALRYFRGATGAEQISEALNRFARNNGAYNWSSLGAASWPTWSSDFIDAPLRGGTTFTRASAGWSVGLADELIEYSNNEARWDASTGQRGFLREETRTNEARSSDMSGAVVGELGAGGSLPTGWTYFTGSDIKIFVMETATLNGWPSVRIQIIGQNNGGSAENIKLVFMSTTDAVAAQNEYWTNSFYIDNLKGPTHTVRADIVERTAAGGFLSVDAQNVPSVIGRQRAVNTHQLTEATVGRVTAEVNQIVQPGQVICNDYWISAPQMEKGQFPTSPIIGPGGPNTRADDFLRVTGTDFSNFWNQTEGTVFLRGMISAGSAVAARPNVWQADSGATTNRYVLSHDSTLNDSRIHLQIYSGNTPQISPAPYFQATPNVPFSLAFAYAANNVTFYGDGTQILLDETVTLPVGVNGMGFFSNSFSTGNGGNGTLFGCAYYKDRLLDTELERMTKASLL